MRNHGMLVHGLRVASILSLAAGSLFLNASCELKADIEAQVRDDFPEGKIRVKYEVASGSASTSGIWPESCTLPDGTQVADVELCCFVKVKGKVGDQSVNKTYKACVTATCAPGGTYKLDIDCSDPLAYQFPLSCFNFRATQTQNGVTGDIPLTEGIQTLSTTHGDVVAEPGHQIVVLGWSSLAPDGAHDVELLWDMTSSAPVEIKALAGGLIRDYEVNNSLVYRNEFLPLVPCPADFAQMPGITIPVSKELESIPVPLDNISECNLTLPSWDCPGGWNLYGTGCAGSGAYTPAMRLESCPTPGGSLDWQVRDALGGASGYVITSTGGPGLQPFGGCDLLVSPVGMNLLPLLLDGVPGAHGAGLGRTSMKLPNSAKLIGTQIHAQAAVFDSGAGNTYALSQGMVITIN